MQRLKHGCQVFYNSLSSKHKKLVIFIMGISLIMGLMLLLFSFNTYGGETPSLVLEQESNDPISITPKDANKPGVVEELPFQLSDPEKESSLEYSIKASVDVGVNCGNNDRDPNKIGRFRLYYYDSNGSPTQVGAATLSCNNENSQISVGTKVRPTGTNIGGSASKEPLLRLAYESNDESVRGAVGSRKYKVEVAEYNNGDPEF